MYNDDVEELYELVKVGTKVTVVDQPIKFGWIDGELYMEAHPSQAEVDQLQIGGKLDSKVAQAAIKQAQTWAGTKASRLDLERVREVARDRLGYPIRITR
jgi:L,D-transpeptidase ErfK/SrfK